MRGSEPELCRTRRPSASVERHLTQELELSGARKAEPRATTGAIAAEKEELSLCGGRGVARSSIPSRWADEQQVAKGAITCAQFYSFWQR